MSRRISLCLYFSANISPADFDQIASALGRTVGAIYDSQQPIVDALRLVWNARGAADIAIIEANASTDHLPGEALEAVASIRTLDRKE